MKDQKEPELPFESPEFKQAWQEWEQYRKERKLPKYVPTGLKKTLTGLVRDSGGNEEVAIKIIEQSIEKNWQGLFQLKGMGSSLNIQKTIINASSNKKSDGAYALLNKIETRQTG